jgi:hypothetical protein
MVVNLVYVLIGAVLLVRHAGAEAEHDQEAGRTHEGKKQVKGMTQPLMSEGHLAFIVIYGLCRNTNKKP